MSHLEEENILSETPNTLTLLVSHFLSPHIVFRGSAFSSGFHQVSPLLSVAGFPTSHQFPHPNYDFCTSFFFLLSHGPPVSSRSSLTSPQYIALNFFPLNSCVSSSTFLSS